MHFFINPTKYKASEFQNEHIYLLIPSVIYKINKTNDKCSKGHRFLLPEGAHIAMLGTYE